jgi:hypothetical protein
MRLLSHLNISQNLRFHKISSEQLTPLIAAFPILTNLFNRYGQTITAADQAFMLPKAAPQTPETNELEKKRDGIFKLIVHAVNDKVKYAVLENVKAAAKIILPILENFAKIDKHEREDETEDIIKLVENLLAHTSELTILGILDDVNSLRALNEEFQSKYEDRIGFKSTNKKKGVSTKHKKVMNKAFSDLMDAIRGQQLVEDDEEKIEKLDEMVTVINSIIDQFNIILHHHQGVNKDSGDEGEEPDDIDEYEE